MKKTALLFTAALMLFMILGVASAAETDNVTSTEDVNLITENNEISLNDSNSDSVLKSAADDDKESALFSSDENNSISAENESSSNSTPVKVNTQLSIGNTYYSKSNSVFKVTLKDFDGNALSGKVVSLKINGKTYKGTTGTDGAVNIKTASLKTGSYSATATFAGDNETIKSTLSKKVNVYNSIGGRTNPTYAYGDSIVYSATFWAGNTQLSNTSVKFTFNGKTYTVKTDSKGLAKFTASTPKPGKYNIKLYNPYSKQTTTNTIKINKAKTKITGSNAYVLPKTKYTYSVKLVNAKKSTALKNTKVYFTYNQKTKAVTTDSTGTAKMTLPALSAGTYKITYSYRGSSKYYAISSTSKIYVKASTTTLTASNLKMQYNDGSLFSLKATNSAKKALANKTVKFTFNGKTTSVKTDSNGVAKLAIGNLKPGTYTVKTKYSTAGLKDYNTKSNTVTIKKQTVSVVAGDLVMEHNNLKNYEVTIKNKTGSPLEGLKVEFGLNSKNHQVTTASDGTATLAINEKIGYYPVTVELGTNPYYTSSKVTKHILVNGTKFSANDITVTVGSGDKFSVTLLDGQDKPISGKTVKFTLNNKETSVQTDAKGIASLDISGLAKGTYTVSFTDGTLSDSKKINVVQTVTLKQVIAASQNVKKYIENNEQLPKTVTVGGITLTTAQYLYLAAQAIINLEANSKANINIKVVTDPAKPEGAANLGNLYNYLQVAKSIVNTINSKGIMPNSVSSTLGNIGYDGLVYALARVVAFYDDYAIMPNYVAIKVIESSISSSLNTKNNIKDLKPYLKSTTNCQVGNSKIKSIVDSVTSGLTTDKAKATAIYNYVRDKVSYSFYYNTRYGAVGTLNSKTGNCVDQSHLLIAMFRTAGLAARYAHGTCHFSDGTYGHVWTQVLIGDTWIVADPTSIRNSFGNVVNWNNYNYQLKGFYAGIEF